MSDSGVSVGDPTRIKLQGLAGGRASVDRPTSLRGMLLTLGGSHQDSMLHWVVPNSSQSCCPIAGAHCDPAPMIGRE